MIRCSTIIATIKRPTLTRAVESVIDQDLGEGKHEIIVVNDSGEPLDEADWLSSPRISVVNTNKCERSVACNVGAALALGKYLHFLDDDDYMLPGSLMALLDVAERSDCPWVYGGLRCIDNKGSVMYDVRPTVRGNIFVLFAVGEALSLIPSLVDREAFLRVGGFDPDLIVLQDRDLACRLALLGDFDRTDQLVACARVGRVGSTTDWGKARWAHRRVREKALSAPKAFSRMLDSVQGNIFLRGRGCRAYLYSAGLNLIAGRLFNGLSRLFWCMRLAALYPFSLEFWRGLTHRPRRESV